MKIMKEGGRDKNPINFPFFLLLLLLPPSHHLYASSYLSNLPSFLSLLFMQHLFKCTPRVFHPCSETNPLNFCSMVHKIGSEEVGGDLQPERRDEREIKLQTSQSQLAPLIHRFSENSCIFEANCNCGSSIEEDYCVH